ncbi:dTDP-4-dehydrorhamnose 3,5-epimerase [Chloroflexia bacterium SDU3-3]|nr:dTDP-4-dehydrorhamnose 3,5-epimerase [Chloroflexia bacterium SDU3-3]
MLFTPTELKDAYVIDLKKFEDKRGFFAHAFSHAEFEQQGLNPNVVDINFSYNRLRGTLRGMHFQRDPYAQVKTVRCVRGAIYDVIIDLRPESPTFKRWVGVELTADNHRALYVPEGFAHGFQTLEDNSDVMYLVSQVYAPSAEGGVRYDDAAFGITWPLPIEMMNDRDLAWPAFAE